NMLSVGYSGTRGIHLLGRGNANLPPPIYNGTSLEFPEGTTVMNPNYDIIRYQFAGTDSWYNALAVSFQRRLAVGLEGQIAYTFSKTISTSQGGYGGGVAGGGNSDAKSLAYMSDNKAVDANHLPQVLNIRYSYDLPLGRNLRGAAHTLVSGWQLQGIITAQSGQPFSVIRANSGFLSALGVDGSATPNLVPGFTREQIIWGAPNVSKDPTGRGRYFNPEAFSLPGDRELGNVGRNFLQGPGLATYGQKDRSMKLLGMCSVLLVSLLIPPLMMSQAVTGGIRGTIQDESGAVIPGVSITATHKTLGITRQAVSDDTGTYLLPDLNAGEWEVKAQLESFQTQVQTFTVVTGSTGNVDFKLKVGASSEVVEVIGQAAQINTTEYKIDGVITRNRIENLPLNGRS